MKGRLVCGLVALLVGLAGLPPASAGASARQALRHDVIQSAAPVATTGGTSSVGATSAILNGIAVNSLSGTSWGFQYGTTVAYGQLTTPVALGTGLIAVSNQVSGLLPATLYHFRLFVAQNGLPVGVGSDLTFRTAAASAPALYGRAVLASRVVRAVGRRLVVSLHCTGAVGGTCAGVVGITVAQGRSKPNLFCAVGAVDLHTSARAQGVRLSETPVCAAALRAAGKHNLPGKLAATFHGAGRAIESAVTLQPLG